MSEDDENVGILGMEMYFPRTYVEQSELEVYDQCPGKYTKGLGQKQMAFCADHEDIQSICLTVLANLIEKYEVDVNSIGHLSVGSETLIDKSKSVKTGLMRLLGANGDVAGLDVHNACFGGTQALMHALDWLRARSGGLLHEKQAIVVMGDIGVYDRGPARCTGGAGAVALLLGRDAPVLLETDHCVYHMRGVYDFYKPMLNSEYPIVDGPLSIQSYVTALHSTYSAFKKTFQAIHGKKPNLDDFKAVLFHSPYAQLVRKSLARLAYHDYCDGVPNESFDGLTDFSAYHDRLNESFEWSIGDKKFEKLIVLGSERLFREKTDRTLDFARRLGNTYTPSLYTGIFSLLVNCDPEELSDGRLLLFSYGSGSAAAMFSLKVKNGHRLRRLKRSAVEARNRLQLRTECSPAEFNAALDMRQDLLDNVPYHPKAGDMRRTDGQLTYPLFDDTYYLADIDLRYRRSYKKYPSSTSSVQTWTAGDDATHEMTNGF